MKIPRKKPDDKKKLVKLKTNKEIEDFIEQKEDSEKVFSLRLPSSLHTKLLYRKIEENESINAYIVRLIKEDLGL